MRLKLAAASGYTPEQLPEWQNAVAARIWDEFYRIEVYREMARSNFALFGNLIANTQFKDGLGTKLKLFESLQKNLYDVLSGNLAKTLYKGYFETSRESGDPRRRTESEILDIVNKL